MRRWGKWLNNGVTTLCENAPVTPDDINDGVPVMRRRQDILKVAGRIISAGQRPTSLRAASMAPGRALSISARASVEFSRHVSGRSKLARRRLIEEFAERIYELSEKIG